ncbi:MAG: CAP domain-containing protein [Actinomycetota bacterium]
MLAFGLLAAGCGSSDDSSEALDLLPSEEAAESAADPAQVRADNQAATDDSSTYGADGGETAPTTPAVPAPPTLSGEAAPAAPASTTTTAAPTTETPAPAPVVEPTTAVMPTTSTSPAPAPVESVAAPVDPADLTAGEGQSAVLLGELRIGLGLNDLARVAEMDAFARDWSRQMAESGTLQHSNGPYGENIAYTTNTALTAAEAAAVFHQLWIDSPGHYRNMTNETYVTSGIGLYKTENGWYGTHVFGF